MYGISGAVQAQESADNWLLDAPAVSFSEKLSNEEPEGYERGAPTTWRGPRSRFRVLKAFWSVVLFFVLLILLPAVCVHRVETLIKEGIDIRRLAGSGAPDENDSRRPDSPDLTELCIELGPWLPATQRPGNPRASPAMVEEVLLGLAEESTSDSPSPSSTAAAFSPCDKAFWTPQSDLAAQERQLEGDPEGDGFVLSTWETGEREAQSLLISQTYPPWRVDPIYQENLVNLQYAQFQSIPFEVQRSSTVSTDVSSSALLQPSTRSLLSTSFARISHEGQYPSSHAAAAPAVSALHASSAYLQQMQPTSSLSTYAIPHPLTRPHMAASYAPIRQEQQSSSLGAGATPTVLDIHGGPSLSQHAYLQSARSQAESNTSRFEHVSPWASRPPSKEKGASTSQQASTGRDRQSPSPEESSASTESGLSPIGDSYVKHPFVRLPVVKPGVLIRQFTVPYTHIKITGARRQVHLLRRIRELFLKDVLDQTETDRLVTLAESLASQMSVAMTFGVSQKRPYLACEQLGRRFLSMNAIYSISKTLNAGWEQDDWWKELTQRIPAEYRPNVYVSPADQTDFNMRLVFDLVKAINLYKSGLSPTDEDVIDLKRRLFCMQQSPYFLKDACWKPWRDDEKAWQKRRGNRRPKD